MNIFQLLSLLLCTVTSVYCELQSIRIFADNLSRINVHIGSIEYDADVAVAKYIKNDEIKAPPGRYCIGTPDLSDMECFAYINYDGEGKSDSPSRQFHLYLKQDKSIDHISYPVSEETRIKINYSQKAPVPNLHPANRQQAKAKQEPKKTIIKKKVEDKDGNIVEIEEEEIVDERSWIQKNWVYVVIPLVLYLLSSDERNQKKTK